MTEAEEESKSRETQASPSPLCSSRATLPLDLPDLQSAFVKATAFVQAAMSPTRSGNWTIGSSLENSGLSGETTPSVLKLLARHAIKLMPNLNGLQSSRPRIEGSH